MRLENKVAVITGGNSGIGLATAREFVAQGARVVIAGRDQITLDRAARELGPMVLALKTDVSKLSDLDHLFKETQRKFGKIDVLFANAGVAQFVPLEKITEDFFENIFDINVKGLFFTVQKAIPYLNPGASVILTSSSIIEKGVPGASVYSASKAAVRSLGRSFAAELTSKGFRVNVLSPGPIATPIFERSGLPPEALKAMEAGMASQVPLKRMGRSEEMAKAVLFLASPDSSYLLGSELTADGGISQL